MTPRQRTIRLPRIERLRDEALDLDREHPGLRGAVVVGHHIGGGVIPAAVASLYHTAPPPGQNSFWRFNPRLTLDCTVPEVRDAPIVSSLTGRDLGMAVAGDGAGYRRFADLAYRVADLGFDLAGVGRFGDLSNERRFEAPDYLLVFLAAFACQRPEGSSIRADIATFEDQGWESVPSERTAILEPRGKAKGSPFVVTIRQGLFAALTEMLAVAGVELAEVTESSITRAESPRADSTPQPAMRNRKTKGQPRDQGKGAKCKAAFIEACQQKETPPTPTELAERFGCSPATASRAIKPLEDQRKTFAKSGRENWEEETGRRHGGSVA